MREKRYEHHGEVRVTFDSRLLDPQRGVSLEKLRRLSAKIVNFEIRTELTPRMRLFVS